MASESIPNKTDHTNTDYNGSVSVKDILVTIDMFLANKYVNDVSSEVILRLLRQRITDPLD